MPESLIPALISDGVCVYTGDCVTVLPSLEAGSADSVITDPPYALDFGGQAWDRRTGFRESLADLDTSGMSDGEVFQAWCRAWAAGVWSVLKPGGHLAAFGGTRTWHRLVAGVEAAGFEIRDQIAWLYSEGMPKTLDISQAIDRQLGAARPDRVVETAERDSILGRTRHVVDKGRPVTVEAQAWQGWGTGLKPAFEPILVARKPVDGTIVGNVLAYGTGGLNIDACRTGGGRWPANVGLDTGQALVLDVATGSYGSHHPVSARFPVFHYQAKAPQRERPRAFGISHVTVKPLGLMRWLVKLLTPRGGLVLEPFAGSGTTIEAALLDGFRIVAIEQNESFLPLIKTRIDRAGNRPAHI